MLGGKLTKNPAVHVTTALLVAVVLGSAPAMAWAATSAKESSVVILIDSSGSMKEQAGNGQTRMEAAKVGLGKVIAALPADAAVGLRVYGASVEDGPKSCTDSDLVVPVKQVDKGALKAGVNKLKPLGDTPIAYSLKKAAADLPEGGSKSIVLVSDGEENCGGNPCKIARQISDSGTELHVDVIGLQVDAKSRNQLSCIANAGGGTYYDVPDAINLPNTLERLSVRAARGYAPAGKPIEGATSADDAAKITDGQWLDDIGDSGKEFYSVLDPGKGTLHLAATLRPLGLGTADGLDIAMTVASKDGKQCGTEARETGIGAFTGNSPITTTFSLLPKMRSDCGKGPYIVTVESPKLSDSQPLSVQVISEPGVKTTEGLPPAAQESDFKVDGEPFSSDIQPTQGSTSPTDAPTLTAGTHSDTALPGELLFYRVDLDWGQQLVCDGRLSAKPGSDFPGFIELQAQTYGFQGGQIANIVAPDSSQMWTGDKAANATATTLPVRYLNRNEAYMRNQRSALAGGYYCAFRITGGTEQAEAVGDLELTINVSTPGVAGEGKPDYLTKQPASAQKSDSANSDQSGGGLGIAAISAIVAAVLAVLALVWFLVRGRNKTAS